MDQLRKIAAGRTLIRDGRIMLDQEKLILWQPHRTHHDGWYVAVEIPREATDEELDRIVHAMVVSLDDKIAMDLKCQPRETVCP